VGLGRRRRASGLRDGDWQASGADIDGRWFATGYEWLDENTLALISAEDEQDAADLLTCDVRERTCAVVVADIGTFEELVDGFALPVGSTIED
jgi:hypothetical protein